MMKGSSSTSSKEDQINARIASLRQELAVAANGKTENGNGSSSSSSSTNGSMEELQEDLRRRQESYIRRQRAYEDRIQSLEDEVKRLQAGRGNWMEKDEKVRNIREMHKQLMKNVEQVQENTARVLKDQEKDLLRAFRARLFDIQSELELEKNKADVGASSWIEKNRQLERGLDWAKEMADRLERLNQSLQKENNRLKSQFKTQEDDREFLIKQLVAVKKDNAQLRQELESKDEVIRKLEEEVESSQQLKKQMMLKREMTQRTFPITPKAGAGGLTLPSATGNVSSSQGAKSANEQILSSDTELRYKEVIKRLKKLLDTERKNLQKVRVAFSTDLETRTELETMLRQCVEDIREKVQKQRKINLVNGSRAEESKFEAGEFNEKDRKEVLELLLSQERVVTMLYKKTFPSASAIPSFFHTDDPAIGGKSLKSINNNNTASQAELIPNTVTSEEKMDEALISETTTPAVVEVNDKK